MKFILNLTKVNYEYFRDNGELILATLNENQEILKEITILRLLLQLLNNLVVIALTK